MLLQLRLLSRSLLESDPTLPLDVYMTVVEVVEADGRWASHMHTGRQLQAGW